MYAFTLPAPYKREGIRPGGPRWDRTSLLPTNLSTVYQTEGVAAREHCEDGVGFEPTEVLPSSVFGTGALIHSCQPSVEEGAGFEPARVLPQLHFRCSAIGQLGEPSVRGAGGIRTRGGHPLRASNAVQ